jgi:hypothetical protein
MLKHVLKMHSVELVTEMLKLSAHHLVDHVMQRNLPMFVIKPLDVQLLVMPPIDALQELIAILKMTRVLIKLALKLEKHVTQRRLLTSLIVLISSAAQQDQLPGRMSAYQPRPVPRRLTMSKLHV